MGILITKRKQMRKLFIRTLALALCLTGTAQALRAQETTAAQTAAAADQRPKTINEMRQERGLTDTHNLFVHYVYEKRVAFVIRRRMTEAKFEQWVNPIIPPTSVDALLNRITDMHDAYRAAGRHHGIDDDLVHICRATATVVLSIISIVYEQVEETAPALA